MIQRTALFLLIISIALSISNIASFFV